MNLRQEKILLILEQKIDISIKDLSNSLGISLNTIRKDIAILQKKNLVIKTHGRVTLQQSYNIPAGNIRHQDNINAKQYIAQLTFEYFSSQRINSIFIDESTTVLEFVKLLSHHFKPLSIISNFLGFLPEIKENNLINTILCGGSWWAYENCTYGNQTVNDLKRLYSEVTIIGCSGIQISGNIYNGNIETSELRQIMYQNSDEIWLLLDSSKFNKSSLIAVLNIHQITKVFTNQAPSLEWLKYFDANNVQVFY